MEQQARFVLVLDGSCAMSELCYRYGISRKTGYEWVSDITARANPPATIGHAPAQAPEHDPPLELDARVSGRPARSG